MAKAGIASRRHCEELIRDGKVTVNDVVRSELPVLVDPEHDVIRVAGRKLRAEKKVYYLLYKPRNVVSTNYDPQGRRRAIDLLTGVPERVYPVGRLDADSKGLLLMTNDGELANQLTHPRYGVPKTYVAEVVGKVAAESLGELRKGMYFPDGRASVEGVKILRSGHTQSLLEIRLREGRNRQIRRMLARLGHNVRQLTRVRIAGLTLRGLGPGKYRALTRSEVEGLRAAAAGKAAESGPRPKASRPRGARKGGLQTIGGRKAPSRSGGAKTGGTRPGGVRQAGTRAGGSKTGGARTAGPRQERGVVKKFRKRTRGSGRGHG